MPIVDSVRYDVECLAWSDPLLRCLLAAESLRADSGLA